MSLFCTSPERLYNGDPESPSRIQRIPHCSKRGFNYVGEQTIKEQMREKRDWWSAAAACLILVFILVVVVGRQLFAARTQPPMPGQSTSSHEATTDDAEMVEARVVRVLHSDPGNAVQQLELEIVGGPRQGQRAEVEQGTSEFTRDGMLYRAGDHVLVTVTIRPDGEQAMMISDYVRTGALALLSMLFIGCTILVSGWKGVRSLMGLAISFVVLMGFVLPHIQAGHDPVLVSIVGSFALLAATLYLTTGWSLKSHVSLLGILCTLVLIGLLSTFAVDFTRLNGTGSEDAMTLLAAGSSVNLRGLLLAGMIIGALGVLDDVVVSQASAVIELGEANATLGWRELYRRAMNIGHDHIAAVVNTLVMAYVGAALPMLLIFQIYPEPWTFTINRSFVTEEIVRSLVGSLGLVLAVPVTTLIASVLYHRQAIHVVTTPATGPESMPSSTPD